MTLLSLVVCTYNRCGSLYLSLESIMKQTIQDFELIVVDNNCTDDTKAVTYELLKGRRFIYLVEEKQGLSNARNCGWQNAKGDFIAYVDDDAKLPEDFCEKLKNVILNIKPTPSVIGGPIYPLYETKPPKWFVDEFEIRTWGDESKYLDGDIAKLGFSGSNMCIKKKILQEFGGFSTAFGMVGKKMGLGEEPHFFNRIYKKYPFFWYQKDLNVNHWTPIRNMSVKYRIKRSFIAGKANAIILYGVEERFLCKRNLFRLKKLLKYYWNFLFSITKCRSKTEFVKEIQRISYVTGHLTGNMK